MRVLAGVVVVSLAPVILAQGITRTDLVTTDLKYSQSQDVLYLAVPSISPHAPNSVLLADPVTGKDRGQIAAGIDPALLALSDDEKYLYVWLAGESVIRRFNLATKQSDIQFPAVLIGGSPQSTVASMLVPQGNPDAVIVFFRSTCCTPSDAGAAVFQNGQQLPDFIAPASIGCSGATYGASPDTLWCQDSEDTGSGFFQLHLDAQGVHAASPGIYLVGTDFYQIPTFYQNRLFNNTLGSVVDPVRKILLALPDFVGAAIGGFTVDPSAAVVYYSRANDAGQPLMIAMDAQKYIPVAATVVSAVLSPMVRCGAGGLAGINESYGLTIIPLSSVPALPAPPPGVPATGSNGITRLQMPNGCLFYCQDEMIYDASSNRLFVAVPDNVVGVGNSVVPIDASTFIPQAPIWVGDQPASLAIAPDGRHLLIGFHGTNQIRRLDLTTSNLDLDTTINSISSGGLPGFTNGVIPLSPSGDSVATELVGIDAVEGYAIGGGVIASYTQGQLTAAATSGGSIVIAENGAGTVLFGLGPGVQSGEALNAHPLPLSASSSAPNSGGSIVGYLTCRQDTCLDSFGTVFDSAHNRVLGVCPTFHLSMELGAPRPIF